MKWMYAVAVIVLVVGYSCTTNQNHDQKKMNAFGLDYTKAWNSQKPEQVAAFFEEGGTLIVNKGEPIKSRSAITDFAKGFMTAFPDMELTMDSLIKKNSSYNYYWTFRGTNKGPGGFGSKVIFSGFEQWTMGSGGLIQMSLGTFDVDDYNRQVKGNSRNE
ncbi:ester cyclase [Croceiramulus getboli]|nr:ester cyclase [Flavobacteriaceae bacterium YJPT1-3]